MANEPQHDAWKTVQFAMQDWHYTTRFILIMAVLTLCAAAFRITTT